MSIHSQVAITLRLADYGKLVLKAKELAYRNPNSVAEYILIVTTGIDKVVIHESDELVTLHWYDITWDADNAEIGMIVNFLKTVPHHFVRCGEEPDDYEDKIKFDCPRHVCIKRVIDIEE